MAILLMTYAVFLTGSWGGFISLIATTVTCVWGFAIRGRRRWLLALTVVACAVLWLSSSMMLGERLQGIFDPQANIASAYGSAQERQALFWRSVEVTIEHPIFGVGPGNFQIIS